MSKGTKIALIVAGGVGVVATGIVLGLKLYKKCERRNRKAAKVDQNIESVLADAPTEECDTCIY